MKNALKIIHEFVVLTNKLQNQFCGSFPNIQDFKYLSDCPRKGSIEIDGQKWNFQRHGVGICFVEEK